jgi:hypothetical protein
LASITSVALRGVSNSDVCGGILPARGALRGADGRCARVLDAIETLSQRGIFFFQGVETLNDRVLVTCPRCCGGPLKREDSDSTPNNTVQLQSSSCPTMRLLNA